MLNSLTIQDFVIVDKLELHFESGMSVLSGETGAGKSILIDALSLCLGARADASQVREGCERANITAIFELNPAAKTVLDEQSIDCAEGQLHLRRAIESNGRSKAYINGTPVPSSTLKDLSHTLIDIHGQHAFQTLTKSSEQLRLLDDFGQHTPLLQATGFAYTQLRRAEKMLQQARVSQEDRKNRLANLQWTLEALHKVAPKAGEWETLNADFDRLSHSAELIEGTEHASNVLSHNDNALLGQLTHLIEKLSHLSNRDPALENMVKTLSEGEILIREASYELGHYVKHSELDPDILAHVELRMSLWHETARKLRVQPETLHAELLRVESEIQGLEESSDLEKIHTELTKASQAYETSAKILSEARKQCATVLSDRVTASMQNLSMRGGVFSISLSNSEPSATGSDSIEFKAAGHPGVSPQAISKVASGGELARISLAITVNTVENTSVPTLIFDEVDSGIGGAVAETVGRYLRLLANNRQVLCVTHLPQVAAQGHQHFQVSKEISAQKTRSTITLLEPLNRVEEIARMLGGQTITEATRTAAQEMIASVRLQ